MGKKFGNSWRAEVEYSYRHNDTGDLTLSSLTVGGVPQVGVAGATFQLDLDDPNTHFIMSNLVYDITNNSLFTPYLGAGVGVGWEEEAEGAEFAYQFLAGINCEIAPKADLIFGYRYTGMTDLDYEYAAGIGYTATAKSHNFEVGFRHSF